MVLICISVCVSGALLAVFVAVVRSRLGLGGLGGIAAIATLISLFFGPALFLQSLLTVVVAVVCHRFRVGPKTAAWGAVGALLASDILVLAMSASELRELSRLRKEYPVESLAERLAYETRMAETGRAKVESPPLVLNPAVDERLSQFESSFYGTSIRRDMLMSLHDRTRDEFVLARGFGPVRMLSVRAKRIQLPDSMPVPVPPRPEPVYDPDQESSVALTSTEIPEPRKAALLAMHDLGVEDFVDFERTGFVTDRDHVVGFGSHRFTRMPDAAGPGEPAPAWQIARLELVSLLKHEAPVAYVSRNLPQMDELRDAPTRPLEEFERQSLERLIADEDLVIDETPERIRMIGSLRAATDCLKCHSVKRGELLGALTYELVPARPTRHNRPQVPPPSS